MSKVVLKRFPAQGPIYAGGTMFENIDAIVKITNIMVGASKAEDAKADKPVEFSLNADPHFHDGWNAACIYKRFPCFDIYDYANEDRFYNSYVLHRGEISPKLCKRFLKEIPIGPDACMATDQAPVEFLPIVYYADGSPTVLVADLAD